MRNQETMKTSNLAGLDTLLSTEKARRRHQLKKSKQKAKLSTDTMITEGMLHTEVMKTDSAAEAAIITKGIAEAISAELILLARIKKKVKGTHVLIIERVVVIRKVETVAEEVTTEASMAHLVETANMGVSVSMAMVSNALMETIVAIFRDVNVRKWANDSIKSQSIQNPITESSTATTPRFS